MAKKREKLTHLSALSFNGGKIKLEPDNVITLTQERQCRNLNLVNVKPVDLTSSRGKIRTAVTPLTVCTDSKSLYDCLVKLGTTNEKRLMIDLLCLRQSYERREIAEVKWIDGNTNPADAMTKGKPCSALKALLDMNKIDLKVTEWVERGQKGMETTKERTSSV